MKAVKMIWTFVHTYFFGVGGLLEKQSFGRLRRWENHIKMDLKEISCDWNLLRCHIHWWGLATVVLNFLDSAARNDDS